MSCLSLWYNDWPLSRTFDSPASDWTYHPTVCFDTWLCAWTRSFTTSASRVAPLYIKTAEALPATSSDMTHVRRHWPQQWLNPLWWQKRLSVYLHRNSLLACPSAVCCAPGSLKWRRLSSDAASCQEIVTKGGHIASTCCCRHMGRIRCRVFDQSFFFFLSFFVQPQQQQRLDVQLHWGFGVWWFLIQSVGRSKPSIGWGEDLFHRLVTILSFDKLSAQMRPTLFCVSFWVLFLHLHTDGLHVQDKVSKQNPPKKKAWDWVICWKKNIVENISRSNPCALSLGIVMLMC